MATTFPNSSLIALHDAVNSADRASRLGRRYEFDLLRGVAALSIFVCHFFGLLGPLPENWTEWISLSDFFQNFGSFGTDTLLLLTGYFVAKSMSSADFLYPLFLKRRLSTVYSVYACVIVAATTVSLLAPGLSKFEEGENPVVFLFRQFLLVPGLFPSEPMLSVAWVLAFVVPGFVLCPLLNWPVMVASVWKKAAYWLSLVLTAGIVFSMLDWGVSGLMLPAGVAAYHCAKAIESKLFGIWLPLAFLLLGLGVIFYSALATAWNWPLPLIGLSGFGVVGLTLIITAIVSTAKSEMPRFLTPLKLLGESGFSFYLLHGSITKLMLVLLFPGFGFHLNSPADLVLALALCLGAAVVGSQILYRAVEVPMRNGGPGNGEVVLSKEEQRQVIESLQPRGPSRYSRANVE